MHLQSNLQTFTDTSQAFYLAISKLIFQSPLREKFPYSELFSPNPGKCGSE